MTTWREWDSNSRYLLSTPDTVVVGRSVLVYNRILGRAPRAYFTLIRILRLSSKPLPFGGRRHDFLSKSCAIGTGPEI